MNFEPRTLNGEKLARMVELEARVQLCSPPSIEIGGQVLVADKSTAYVEFFLSHAFPVVTCDQTALHPQVVANSFRSMQHKVFDLAHLMRKYNPKEVDRDHILGTVIGVEFPELKSEGRNPKAEGNPKSEGREQNNTREANTLAFPKWEVQGDRSLAPGIRGVACMHKNAAEVEQILKKHESGQLRWTVSMEQEYFLETSGFIVKSKSQIPNPKKIPSSKVEGLEDWAKRTPEDLAALGWTYIPAVEAPMGLLKCFDGEESKVTRDWEGMETVVLFGGLDGEIHYKGVGLTPKGKEDEASVGQMLASKAGAEVLLPDVLAPLWQMAKWEP